MSFMVNKYSRSNGIALIGIIVAIVLMGLLGGSVLMLITTSSMESLETLNWSKAFFAAESGISKAKEYISTNAAWYTNLNMRGMMIGSASFTNVITTNATTTIITSTGIQGDSRWTSRWSPAGGEITRAIVVYKQTTDPYPRYRTCSNLRRLSDELTASSVVAAVYWQRIVASPQTNEYLLVTQNTQQRIYAQTYSNGTWGANTLLGTSAVATTRGFDVAYESLNGCGMVVYSVGNSSNPQYRVWTSNIWSPPGFIPINTSATNPASWIRLISKPGTNEIMCLARWRKTTAPAGNYSSAIIWNGTIWTNRITLETNCASEILYETMDGAYSASTALVVYINGNTPAQRRIPKYRTYTNGGWSAQNTMPQLPTANTQPRWIRVEYSPDGTLAYAGLLISNTRLQGKYWRGSVWDTTTYYNFGNVTIEVSTNRAFDIAWSSQTNTLMVVYSQQNRNYQSFLLETGGGTSSSNGNLVSTDDGQKCILQADPFTSEFYYMAIDDQDDVNFQRWTGSAWTLFPEPEINSPLAYNAIDFAFRRDSASTNCWPVR